ncbi:unnamed protein product [Paramecium primaurelia]|uniref:Uncharacterized protein n=1 Tax=Paramecium primaurelia TaxID=5886 RepID=A0A8S1PJF9_PARPR|nr:unnamed protein product [Paramecium primaurelia]
MYQSNLEEYQKLPRQIREQINQKYFFQRSPLSTIEKSFYRYMHQVYQENQDQQIIVKDFFISSYNPNSKEEKAAQQQIKVCFHLNKDIFYLMGSLKELSYMNENNEKKSLQVCDVYNQYLSPLHFEISLPQTMEAINQQKLEQNINHFFLAEKLKKNNIEVLNKHNVLFRDISEQSFSTYFMNYDIIKLSESNNFAFETQMEPNLIRYFSVQNNNNRYFFDNNQNRQFDLTFVVGIQSDEQQTINQNIYKYCLMDEDDPNQLQEYNNTKDLLETIQKQLKQLKNAIRIKIYSCEFDVIVHPNNENYYNLNQDNKMDIFNDYLQQASLYDSIIQQLKYENDQWTFNLKKDKLIFYKQANHYPDHFYLCTQQTAVIQCKNANIKISQNHVAQTEIIQQS